MKRVNHHQQGFTIVELMIATAVFSTVLLLCAIAIVHIGKMYYKGTIINRTQDISRKVADDVSRSIQFGSTSATPASFVRPGTPSGGVSSWCIGDIRYSYTTASSRGTGAGQVPHVLWRERGADAACTPLNIFSLTSAQVAAGEEMLGENMRVPTFSVRHISGNLWEVIIVISYGDDAGLFTDSTFSICRGASAGGQFCAASRYETNVVKRL